MQIILYFLLAIFFYCPQVQAFSAESFAKNFYGDIKERVENEEKITVSGRVNFSTGLSHNIVEELMKGNLSTENEQQVRKYCGEEGLIFNSVCRENLKKTVVLEMDLAEMETQMDLELSADEIWANGTLQDSPFDLVVDLNIIDVILFGTSAEIPLARWDKVDKKDKLEPVVADRISNSPLKNNLIVVGEDGEGDTWKDDDNYEHDDDINLNGEKISFDLAGIFKKPELDSENLQCIDPESIIFLSSNINENNNNNENGGVKVGEPENEEGNTNGNNSESLNTENDELDDKPLPEGDLFTLADTEEKETCKKGMYGGYFCPEEVGDENESCNPLEQACKKCLTKEDSDVEFCVTWEFKNSEHSLLSSLWMEDSIQSYTETALKVYDNLIGVAPLTPKKNQNQGGFLTHMSDLDRPIAKMIYIKGKIPDEWTAESKLKDFSHEALVGDWRRIWFATRPAYNEEGNAFKNYDRSIQRFTSESNEVDMLEGSRINAEMDSFNRMSSDESVAIYYKNVENNLEHFRKNFFEVFNETIKEFPFEEVEGVKKNMCEK